MNKLNVTSVKLNVKNVMECMRALELDGLVEAVKPLGDVQVPEDEGIDDDDGHVGNMRKKRNGDDDDNDKRSKWTEREKNKMKERVKEKKRREKEKEKEREKTKRKAKAKEKQKKEKQKAKEKEKGKERARRTKRKRKEKERQQEPLRGRNENSKSAPRPKKRRKVVIEDDDEDSEPPLISLNDEGNLDFVQQKKRKQVSSASSASSSSVSSRSASASSSSSSSSSSSENTSSSETDSESDSDDSVSSVDSADLDGRVVQFKPKSSTAFAAAHSQSLSFAGAGLQDLSDTAIVYRATNRLTIPRGQNQTPCGKCPQFGFCEEEGPVNADSCRYYADWLGDRVGGWDAEGRNRFHPVDREYEEGPVTQDSEGEE